MAETPVRLHTLPQLRVEVDGVEVASFQRQKLCAALLTFIAVERSVTRARAIGTFWPDRRDESARHALSQTLYEIRQDLPTDPFVAKGDRIRSCDALWVDIVALEAALEAGDAREACRLCRGPFLSNTWLWRTNEWDQWVHVQQVRVAKLNRTARRQLMAELSAPDRVTEALAAARDWVESDPTDDEANHLLIELLGLTGQRTEALRHYDAYARLVRHELEVEPLDDTQNLVEAIRTGRLETRTQPLHSPGPEPAVPTPGTAPPPPAAADARSPDADPVVTELAGHVEVVRLIGTGSVARVYIAREKALGRLVAVKVLSEELARDRTARLRFEREARAAARIHHPNVVPVYWVAQTTSGRPFIAMPYIRGGSLADRISVWGRLDLDEARNVIRQVATALAEAHRLGVVHRDVRPANVLYEQEAARCMLCDFGLATILDEVATSFVRLTKTGEITGNPSCISPEQLLGHPVSEKTDIYGLGCLAFEVLTGRAPFDVESAAGFTTAHVRERPHRTSDFRDDVPPALDDLIDRCLAKRPELRPGVAEVIAGLG